MDRLLVFWIRERLVNMEEEEDENSQRYRYNDSVRRIMIRLHYYVRESWPETVMAFNDFIYFMFIPTTGARVCNGPRVGV